MKKIEQQIGQLDQPAKTAAMDGQAGQTEAETGAPKRDGEETKEHVKGSA